MNPSAIPTQNGYNPNTTYTPYNAQGNAALDSAQTTMQQPTQPNQPQVPAQKGNWFTHLLPTIGSIAAPVIGGLLAPETGGLSLLAGLALAGGGSAAGKATQQAVEGSGINPVDIAKSAGEGAVGQLAGAGLGGVAKAATGAVSKIADKGATSLVQGQFAKGTIDNATAQTLRDMGITDARQVASIAPHSTGDTGAISLGVKRGLTEADTGADFSNLSKTGQNLVSENQMQLNPASVPSINKTIQSALLKSVNPEDVTQVGGKAGSTVNTFQPGALGNVLPEDAFKVTQNFEALANKAYQGAYDKMGNVNPDQLAKFNVFKGLANEARSATFGGETPIPLSEANKAQIISELAPMKDVSPEAYNWHVNQVTNANTLQDLRPIQAPMVRANTALNTTQNIADKNNGTTAGNIIKSVTPLAAGMAAGPLGAAAGAIPSLIGTDAADRTGAAVLSKLANAGVTKKVANAIPPVLTGAAQFITHAPDSQANPVNLNLGNNNMQPQTPGLDPNSLNSLLLQLAAAESANPGTAGAGAAGLQQIVPQIQNTNVAQNSLLGAENAFQEAGGGQGGVLGTLAKVLGGITGNPANQYEQQRQQLVHQLTPLGIPTSAVPDITGNNLSAQNQFQTLQQMINARLNGGSLSAIPVM